MINNQIVRIKDCVKHKKGNILCDMDGEKVMLSIQNGKYYNLGAIGGEIWELLVEPMTVSILITKLTSEYDVERKDCQDHVLEFLEMLLSEDLIEIVSK